MRPDVCDVMVAVGFIITECALAQIGFWAAVAGFGILLALLGAVGALGKGLRQ
jgi:hypothetical protein